MAAPVVPTMLARRKPATIIPAFESGVPRRYHIKRKQERNEAEVINEHHVYHGVACRGDAGRKGDCREGRR